MQVVKKIVALNGVTATTTSEKIWVGDYCKVGILMRRADNAGGSSAFTFKGGFGETAGESPTMTALNTLISNVTNTNAQTLTRVNGATISAANGDAFLWLDLETTPVTHLEVTVTETADGTHSCWFYGFCD